MYTQICFCLLCKLRLNYFLRNIFSYLKKIDLQTLYTELADQPPHTSPDAHFLLQLLACPCLPYVIPHRHPFPSWNIKESYRSLIFNRILTNEKRKYSTKINRCTLFSGFFYFYHFSLRLEIFYMDLLHEEEQRESTSIWNEYLSLTCIAA